MGLAKYRTAVITLSDKGAAGERKDESGLAICERLRQNGQYEIVETLLLPDDCALLKTQLVRICDEKLADLILTTGGTGFSKRDVTPEATLAVAERNAPGIAEYLRFRSMQITPKAGKYEGGKGKFGILAACARSWAEHHAGKSRRVRRKIEDEATRRFFYGLSSEQMA